MTKLLNVADPPTPVVAFVLPLAKEPEFNVRVIATLLEATLFPDEPWTCTTTLDIATPATFVTAGAVVKTSFVPAVPADSLSVPKFVVPLAMPVMTIVLDVDSTILFVASGDTAVGRTWIPDQVRTVLAVPPSGAATVMVMSVVVTAAVSEFKVSNGLVPLPVREVTTLTVAAGLNWNPGATFKIIVPTPISAVAPSVISGPVRLE